MARRRRSTRNQRQTSPNTGVDAANGASGRRRRRSSGGLGPLFWIMAGVVLVVIVAGFIFMGPVGSGGNEASQTSDTPREISVSRKNKPFPDVQPWTGTIGGQHGTVRQGMTRSEIVQQFGRAQIRRTDNSRTTAGVDIWEYYDDPEKAGILRSGGGRRLIVKIDKGSDKVVWFMPPQSNNYK